MNTANAATIHELERLAALRRYDVLDTAPEESFDRITRLAKTSLKVPIALISLIDVHRQWFKSRQGLDVPETPRDVSFCTRTIETDEPLVVRDAWKDERFRDNPLVQEAPHIRFYAGVPLTTPDGHNIGTLCAIDREPRDVTAQELEVLSDLARLVIDELELRRLANTDCLTDARTRRSFEADGGKEVERARRHARPLSAIALDIDHFKSVNDTFGHAAGDRVLQHVAALCKSSLRPNDIFARLGGEEFVIMLPETPAASAVRLAERIRSAIAETPIQVHDAACAVTASFGICDYLGGEDTLSDMVKRADAALYQAKSGGRDRCCVAGAPGRLSAA